MCMLIVLRYRMRHKGIRCIYCARGVERDTLAQVKGPHSVCRVSLAWLAFRPSILEVAAGSAPCHPVVRYAHLACFVCFCVGRGFKENRMW